jgi:hypothetical protein
MGLDACSGSAKKWPKRPRVHGPGTSVWEQALAPWAGAQTSARVQQASYVVKKIGRRRILSVLCSVALTIGHSAPFSSD